MIGCGGPIFMRQRCGGVLTLLMKTLLTSGCINQWGAGQVTPVHIFAIHY